MPQFGDADDGRLHIFSGYGAWKPQDPRHLLGPAGCLFQTGDWSHLADEWAGWESAWWGFDPSSAAAPRPAGAPPVRHFPHAGLTAIRRGRDFLLITNGVVGTGGFGNHKHNDLLGFEYHLDAEPVIVDPGSYVYTSDPDARNLFRSTRLHNTVSIDDQEQNEIRPDWLFRTFEKATPEHLAIGEDAVVFEYRGRHSGYTRLPEPVVHERTFRLSRSDGSLAIVDVLDGRGGHRLRWHFHFAPGVTASVRSPGVVDIRAATTALQMTVPPTLQPTVRPSWYSPSYGIREQCVAVDLEAFVGLDGRHEYAFHLTRR
jgi:uncharacterized heparinase superfamily protein